ncbi:hypothetical protein [Fimbriimonas ginsengisoli]|uniref:Uncharacterized protein n=1 Tax=Fimbriimonas ginsengisoli Gsoil 348 TaxID=661478 RepID=A0A068NWW6_FIMGI|nr:hypothetical protein [Fimbriimonas ginsengisoli]AIE87275.1 hypothetical protein OP10G_3907 [Fimbriimonas ginsengisoli Gsoil 348]
MLHSLGNELGYLRTYAYDPVGNVYMLTSFSGDDTGYRYDGVNQLTTTIEGVSLTTYSYDRNGSLSGNRSGRDGLYLRYGRRVPPHLARHERREPEELDIRRERQACQVTTLERVR